MSQKQFKYTYYQQSILLIKQQVKNIKPWQNIETADPKHLMVMETKPDSTHFLIQAAIQLTTSTLIISI